jgi:hypothetical protein
LSKHCEFCGRFFTPDPRVGSRQRSCFSPQCQDARKRSSKRAWRERETPRGYFTGRYGYLKEWRRKRRLAAAEVIQDEIPHAKPVLKLVLWLPGTRRSMIQDEIRLKRLSSTEFAATGVTKRMIQDAIARPP